MTLPRVSVAIPLYRPEPGHITELTEHLRRCRTVGEVVVTDDDPAHTERLGILDALRDGLDGRELRYVANDRQLGMTGNWNAAVSLCREPLVVLHCQDDRLRPGRFDTLVERLAGSVDIDIAIGAYSNVTDGRDLGRPSRFGNTATERHVETFEELVTNSLTFGNVYGFPSSTVFRKDAWRSVGGYLERYEHAADLDFVLRMAERRGHAVVDPEPVADRRVHGANLTLHHVASGATGRDRERFLADFGELLDSASDRRRAHAMMAARSLNDAVRHLKAGRWRGVKESAPVLAAHAARGAAALPWAAARVAEDQRATPRTTVEERAVEGRAAVLHDRTLRRAAHEEGGASMAEEQEDGPRVDALLAYLRSIDSTHALSERYAEVARQIASIVQPTSLLEIGAGRNPLLLETADRLGLRYIMNDISESELERAPDGYQKLCFDIGGRLTTDETFDLVMSRLVFEHVRHGADALRNSAQLLTPGGFAIHFAPTLYALPFVANKFLPDGLASKALRLFNPRDEEATPKFRAYYDHCRTTRRAVAEAEQLVAPCRLHVVPYYEHEYYRRIPIVREVADLVHDAARARDLRPLSTYAFFVIHRDRDRDRD